MPWKSSRHWEMQQCLLTGKHWLRFIWICFLLNTIQTDIFLFSLFQLMLTGWLPDCTGKKKRNFNYISNWEQNCYCSPHNQWEDDVSEVICEQKLVRTAVCNDIRRSQSCLCLLLSYLGSEFGGNTLSVMSPPCCFEMDDALCHSNTRSALHSATFCLEDGARRLTLLKGSPFP